MNAPIPPWEVLARDEAFRCPVFSVERARMQERPTDGQGAAPPADFYVIRPPDWVNVVALLPDDQVVLIEQWRHGVGRPTLEVPGGVVEPGEALAAAAARELAEETGYTAAHWTLLGVAEPNPAIQNNRCATFLAEDCRPGPTRFDAHERIRTVTVRFDEALGQVARGEITHALCITALMYAQLRRLGSK